VNGNAFSLDHLTPTQFEEFCFDLLGENGFINIKWKKGTGLSTSPSDHGRDIECQYERVDVDGHKYLETWFVECKHSVKGVSPDKIQGAFSWATANRPDRLLLIASNFLSNPTHDYIENFVVNNRPPFKIKIWQKPELEKLTAGNIKLLRKYKIEGEFPFLTIMHPAHLLYIKNLQLNSVDYFFKVLDKLEPLKRDRLLSWVDEIIIRPRYRESVTGKERSIDLRIDEVSYEVFKEKCFEFASFFYGAFLVSALVNFILQAVFGGGDTTSINEKLAEFEDHIQFIEGMKSVHEGRSDEEYHKIGLNFVIKELKNREADFHERTVSESLDFVGNMFKQRIRDYPNDAKEMYQLYVYFCEHVVKELLIEKEIA
jgi:hypothetical protein